LIYELDRFFGFGTVARVETRSLSILQSEYMSLKGWVGSGLSVGTTLTKKSTLTHTGSDFLETKPNRNRTYLEGVGDCKCA